LIGGPSDRIDGLKGSSGQQIQQQKISTSPFSINVDEQSCEDRESNRGPPPSHEESKKGSAAGYTTGVI